MNPEFIPTSFRTWMETLLLPRGNEPEWPLLLREMLTTEYRRQSGRCIVYAGEEVFIDRDCHTKVPAEGTENAAVYGLYRRCHEHNLGCFNIDGDVYWLLGYRWPNQGAEAGRQADLVGLSSDGGLVVFECKLKTNNYGPLAATLEGLDYLACLTSCPNFARIVSGFHQWAAKEERTVPPLFRGIVPRPEGRHELVVLAEPAYFDLYRRSGRGRGWEDFAKISHAGTPPIRFAQCDFLSTSATWVVT